MGPEKKHFQQVPRQCCCCWPGYFRICCLRLFAPKGSASPVPKRPSQPVVLVQILPLSVNSYFNWGLLLSKGWFLSKDVEKINLWCSISKQGNVSGRGGVWNQAMEASQSKKLQSGACVCGEDKGSGLLLQKWRPGSQAWCCVQETQSQQPRAGWGPMEWTWVHRYWP